MNKALAVGWIVSLFLISLASVTAEANYTGEEVGLTSGVDYKVGDNVRTLVYIQDGESQKVKLFSKVPGVWYVSDEHNVLEFEDPRVHATDANSSDGFVLGRVLVAEVDVEKPQFTLETNSSFILEEGTIYGFKFVSEEEGPQTTIWKRVARDDEWMEKVYRESYYNALRQANKDSNKSCGYVLEQTKKECAKRGIEVFALLTPDKKHVVPIARIPLNQGKNHVLVGIQEPELIGAYGVFKDGVYQGWFEGKLYADWNLNTFSSKGTSTFKGITELHSWQNQLFIRQTYPGER